MRKLTKSKREAASKNALDGEASALKCAEAHIETGKRLARRYPHLASEMISGAEKSAELCIAAASRERDKLLTIR